ncbi:MAG: CRISPR-associated helicase Cas3 [Myxococcales bacterium]|nr:CRISPR-associated helicase Cas3 [Myxococcales bacterium]
MTSAAYAAWFEELCGFAPHPWQAVLGDENLCQERLLRIPTGFGKTAGTVLSWMWHRVHRGDERWPRRLVFCLPMRVLVEQTERAIREWIDRAGFGTQIGLHVLMGGVEAQAWALEPERPAILVGTQDMLLSRALNRGYGAARGRWPMEYGLLHVDALWIMDEVQIMGVGLATSVQLAAFRRAESDAGRMPRPSACWWMSATLQPAWLATVDFAARARSLDDEMLSISADSRVGGLWNVDKAIEHLGSSSAPDEIAHLAAIRHQPGSLTLIVVNTVKRAVEIRDALAQRYAGGKGAKRRAVADAPELCLVHSRFRGAERARWANDFLRRGAALGPAGRIIIATQVIEAGVDISARLLVTDLAPWPSLVQRFGRVARYAGESGTIVVAGAPATEDKAARPYIPSELAAAAEALRRLVDLGLDGSPRGLESFGDRISHDDPAFLTRLYPYQPGQVLRRSDLDELFDTTPDLSGTDLDISAFIRDGDERDVNVFWRRLDDDVVETIAPRREELCPVPVHELRDWLRHFKAADERPLVRDYIKGKWVRRSPDKLVPGMIVLLPAQLGGYDVKIGWSPKLEDVVPVEVVPPSADPFTKTAESEDNDELSVAKWKTIATHGREARDRAAEIAQALGVARPLRACVELAARWHDAGKGHDVFQDAIKRDARIEHEMVERRDLAKAPDGAWRRPHPYPNKPGFRHELASTLMLFEVLRRTQPDHPALAGGVAQLLAAMGETTEEIAEHDIIPNSHPIARELAALSADDFDLVAWLICTHHGKVRGSWSSTVLDQDAGHGGIHGVCENDRVGACALATSEGDIVELPPTMLSLTLGSLGAGARYGRSWTERATSLIARIGVFQLAWLEAILRTADVRASQMSDEDPLL